MDLTRERRSRRNANIKRARVGVYTAGWLSAQDSIDALHNTLPRTHDAMRLVQALVERLGERTWPDPYHKDGDTVLRFRDPLRPEWVLPQPFISLELDTTPPPKFELAPELKARMPERMPILPSGSNQRPARLLLGDGFAELRVEYDVRGLLQEMTVATGDTWSGHDLPCTWDPFGQNPDRRPWKVFCRPDLDPGGHPVEELADMIAELRPDQDVPIRVRVPAPVPGGAWGTWLRGQNALIHRFWEREEALDGGVAIVDGITGEVCVWGDDPDLAWAAFQAELRRTIPLPPPEPPPVDLPEPMEPEHTEEHDEEKGVTRYGMKMTIMMVPAKVIPWPEPRAENVPAVMLPVPPLAVMPPILRRLGFERVVRLIGDHGEIAHASVRMEPGGFTLVGHRAVPAIDPATFEEDLARCDVARAAALREFRPDAADPMRHDEYPVRELFWTTLDDHGRELEGIRPGGTSFSAGWSPRSLQTGLQSQIVRVSGLSV